MNNLVVVCNACPAGAIERHFPEHILVNDAEIFKALNGGDLFGEYYSIDTLDELCRDLIRNSGDTPVVIHTFNTRIVNLIEQKSFGDESVTTDCFLVYKDGGFLPLLNVPLMRQKTKVQLLGDALSAVYIESEVDSL